MDRLSEIFHLIEYDELPRDNKYRDEIITSISQSIPLLANRKVIGIGHSAYVFEGTQDNTVLKLTTDPASIMFAYHVNNKQTIGSKHFPKFYKDYGTVGTFKIADDNGYAGEIPLVLYEVEKITNKPSYVLDITEVATDHIIDIQPILQTQQELKLNSAEDFKKLDHFKHSSILIYLKLKSRWNAKGFKNESLLDAIFSVIDFVRESFATTNIMLRDNGDIVFTDPVSNWLCTEMFKLHQKPIYQVLNHNIL